MTPPTRRLGGGGRGGPRPGAPNRRQGIGIQFSKTDASVVAREKIETLLGPALKSPPSSYTI